MRDAVENRNEQQLIELLDNATGKELYFQAPFSYRSKNKYRVHTPLIEAVVSGSYKLTEILLHKGANVDLKGSCVTGRVQQWPLKIAACEKHFDMCHLLLKYGATVHHERDSINVLNGIVSRTTAKGDDYWNIAFLLIEHGAEFDPSPLYKYHTDISLVESFLDELYRKGFQVPFEKTLYLTMNWSRYNQHVQHVELHTIRIMNYPGLRSKLKPSTLNHFHPFRSCFHMAASKGFVRIMLMLIRANPLLMVSENWLKKANFPRALTRHKDFTSWLSEHASAFPTLQELCKSTITYHCTRSNVQMLPLPRSLKDFLLLNEFRKMFNTLSMA